VADYKLSLQKNYYLVYQILRHMLKYLISLALLSSSIFSFGQSTASDPELVNTENQLYTMLTTNNFTGLESLYDDSFIGILADGKSVAKSAMVEYQKAKDPRIVKSFENLETRIFGDVAISSGTELNKSKAGSIVGQLKFIRIFIKKDKNWKIVNSQFTTII